MRRAERVLSAAWPWAWAALTALPYLAAWLWTAPGDRYLWLLPPYYEDSQAYLAWAKQAALGATLFKLKLTAIPHEPFLLQPFFLAVGRLSAWTGWPLGVSQLLLRCAGVAAFWLAFQRMARRRGFSGAALWSALLLAGFGAGLGGASLLLLDAATMRAHMPVDIWLVDANTAWSLTWNGLFPWSLALIVFYVDCVGRAAEGERGPSGWLGGLALGLLLLVHPYSAPLLAALAVFECVRRGRPAALAPLLLPALPAAAHAGWLSWTNPLVARHGQAGRMTTPTWTAVLLGFGPCLALAAGGALSGGRAFLRRHAALLAWAAGALLLSRAPVWFQRKLLFGAQLPLALLAGAAVAELAERDGGGRRVAAGLTALALALGAPSWGYIAYNTRLSLSLRESGRYYVSERVQEGLDALAKLGGTEQVVFCAVETGGLVAMSTGKTVVWGHWAQSVDYEETRAWADALLAAGDPKAKAASLWGRVDYVFAEGRLKEEVDSGRLRWLKGASRTAYAGPEADVYVRP